MKLTRADSDAQALVAAYGDRGFRINEDRIEGSVLICNGGAESWPVTDVAGITAENLTRVIDADPAVELLIVGTGDSLALLPADTRSALEERAIPYDVMDTGAAARTFNVLALEGRRVAAALIAVA